MEKISACLALSAILERTRLNVRLSVKGKKVDIRIAPSARQLIPLTLLAEALKKFEQAFGVSVSYSIAYEKQLAAAPAETIDIFLMALGSELERHVVLWCRERSPDSGAPYHRPLPGRSAGSAQLH